MKGHLIKTYLKKKLLKVEEKWLSRNSESFCPFQEESKAIFFIN